MFGLKKSGDVNLFLSEKALEDSSDINLIARDLKDKRLYFGLISIDLTYLNFKLKSHTEADKFKNRIVNILKNSKLIKYYFKIAGKYFVFSEKSLLELEKLIGKEEKDFLELNGMNSNKRLIYLVSSRSQNLTYAEKEFFEFGPYEHEIQSLLSDVFSKHRFLIMQKKYLKKYLDNLNQDLSSLFNDKSKLLKNIDSRKRDIFNYEILMNLEINEFNKTILQLKRTYAGSDYILDIFNILERIKYGDPAYNINSLLNPAIKYQIYFNFQKALLMLFKIEKVFGFFERESLNKRESSIDPILLFNKEDTIVERRRKLEYWFDSVIKPFEKTMIPSQKALANNIKLAIKSNLKSQKVEKNISKQVQELFDTFSIRGFFSTGIESIKVNDDVAEFLHWQFEYNHGHNSNNKLNYYCNGKDKRKPIFKHGNFYGALDDPKMILRNYEYFLTEDFLLKGQNKIHSVFIELDGFNAFNQYNFVNEKDSYYTEMIYSFYNIANDYIKKYNDNSEILFLFSKMLVSILGDEFFFFFLTKDEITSKQKQVLENFVTEVKSSILDMTEDMPFLKTEKIQRNTQIGEIIFRKPITKYLSMEVAHVGVSGALIYNANFSFTDSLREIKFEQLNHVLEHSVEDFVKKKKHVGNLSLVEFSILGKPIRKLVYKRGFLDWVRG